MTTETTGDLDELYKILCGIKLIAEQDKPEHVGIVNDLEELLCMVERTLDTNGDAAGLKFCSAALRIVQRVAESEGIKYG